MKNLFYLGIISLLFFACKNEAISPQEKTDRETLDPKWIKLTIPEGREALAVAGSIDDTLLVTTWSKTYRSVDKGKTWQLSRDFNSVIRGLLTNKDTVITLVATGGLELKDTYVASSAQYFTLDYGLTWTHYQKMDASNRFKKIGITDVRDGISYALKYNVQYISDNSYTHKPTDIVKVTAKGEQKLEFPFIRKLNNLSFDKNNRLYVAAQGIDYTSGEKTRYDNSPAIVYVSRKPLP